MRRSQAVNLLGAVVTTIVLVDVFANKIVHGAWIAVLAMVVLFFLMRAINRYYARVTHEIAADDATPTLPPAVHGLVLISRLHKPGLRALSFARATHPDVLEAVTIAVNDEDTRELLAEWERRGVPVPLKVLEAPYRDMLRPLVDYVRTLRQRAPKAVVSVFIPEYVTMHWWQGVLHNQSALRLKARLLFTPGGVVVNVPYQLWVTDQGWLGDRPVGEPVPAPAQSGS
jgi:hypothetical protein